MKAIRGATTVEQDTPQEIRSAIAELLTQICTQNQLNEEEMLCILFSNTADIRSLKKINGVGPKSAERMVVELRDKIRDIDPSAEFTAGAESSAAPDRNTEDAIMAL